MAGLTTSDYERVLGFLHEAYGVDTPDPFPLHVVERLRELIPAAAVTYREWQGARASLVLAANDPD